MKYMKKVGFRFLMGALGALVLFSCNKQPVDPKPYDPTLILPQRIAPDFAGRYPGVMIRSTTADPNAEYFEITFTDQEGAGNRTVYRNGEWMVSEKQLDPEVFLGQLPGPVQQTYLRTGITHEHFGQNDYAVEISRQGLSQKQYEITCVAPYLDGEELVENLLYHIDIAEDGTLLTCSHEYLGKSAETVDLRPALETIRGKYANATVVGMVENGNYAHVYVRDGGVLKSVVFREYWKDFEADEFEWRYTLQDLPLDTELPEHVRVAIADYLDLHPGLEWTGLTLLETVDGFSYGVTFGPVLHSTSFYIYAEERAQ